MIIVGDPEQCLREDAAVRRPRRRPADLLRAVRPPARTSRSCGRSSCSARRSSPSSRSGVQTDPGRAEEPADPSRACGSSIDATRTDDTPVPDYPGLLRLDGKRFVVLGAGQGIGRQATHALASVGRAARAASTRTPTSPPTSPRRSTASAWSGDATDRARRRAPVRRRRVAQARRHRRRRRHHRHGAVRRHHRDDRRRLGLALRHRAAPRLPGHAARGPARWQRAAAASMVFVASVSGITSAPLHAAYGAAKAGLMSLVAPARSSWARRHPGQRRRARRGVDAAGLGVPRRGGRASATSRTRPLRRVALPADIAAALLFLASDLVGVRHRPDAVVDGGVGAKFPYPMADCDGRRRRPTAEPFLRGCAWPAHRRASRTPAADPADSRAAARRHVAARRGSPSACASSSSATPRPSRSPTRPRTDDLGYRGDGRGHAPSRCARRRRPVDEQAAVARRRHACGSALGARHARRARRSSTCPRACGRSCCRSPGVGGAHRARARPAPLAGVRRLDRRGLGRDRAGRRVAGGRRPRATGSTSCNLGYAGAARGEIASAEQVADARRRRHLDHPTARTAGPASRHSAGMMRAEHRARSSTSCAQGHPDTPIVVGAARCCGPTPRPRPTASAPRSPTCGGRWRTVARERIDDGDARADAGARAATCSTADHLPDGIHPGDEGHQMLAEAFGGAVREALEAS